MADESKQIYIPNQSIAGNFIEEIGGAFCTNRFPASGFDVYGQEGDMISIPCMHCQEDFEVPPDMLMPLIPMCPKCNKDFQESEVKKYNRWYRKLLRKFTSHNMGSTSD
jgi:NAD-dependent SIR2 family protein deacetylase